MSNQPASILIVDDEAINRKLLEMLLHSQKYETMSAASGEDALTVIARTPPDLILLDLVMPGMSGNELAMTLKASPLTSHIPIIMITAEGERTARLLALDSGAEDFLTKPIDRAELWLRVRNLLRLKALSDLQLNSGAILEAEVRSRTNDLQRFRSAMDSTVDAILLVDRATMRFIEINSTACHMFGYSRSELLRMGPADLGVVPAEKDIERLYDMIIDGHDADEINERSVRRRDGSIVEVEVQRHTMNSGGDWIIVTVLRDITSQKLVEQRLHKMAHYDMLTGLPNRSLFYETLTKSLARAADLQCGLAVLFIDLDRFKNVNDTLGHDAGDALLRLVGDRLIDCVRVRDTIGRLGGDEFSVILLAEDAMQAATLVANKLRDTLRAPFDVNGHEVSVTASVGISVYSQDSDDAGVLIKYSDTAMYRAKQSGGDTSRFFSAEMNVELIEKIELEAALRKAIENDEFVLHYQPKFGLESGLIVGVEALLRWARPGHGLVPPASFIPILEDTGLIVAVGSWVLNTACRQIGLWLRSGVGPVPISINVACKQFIDNDLEEEITRALAHNAISGDLLELELTETTLMANTERTAATLRNLKTQGVQISIDDFGTGYSSLAYLRRFTIDKLKIDRTFVSEMTSNADDAAIVLAIISLAHTLRLGVIAEGVETADQLSFLRLHRCDEIQGYYSGRPVAPAEIEALMRGGDYGLFTGWPRDADAGGGLPHLADPPSGRDLGAVPR